MRFLYQILKITKKMLKIMQKTSMGVGGNMAKFSNYNKKKYMGFFFKKIKKCVFFDFFLIFSIFNKKIEKIFSELHIECKNNCLFIKNKMFRLITIFKVFRLITEYFL